MADAGHNVVTKKELENFIKRIEKLTEDRKAIGEDIKNVMLEAKSKGYDGKTVKEMLKLRALDSEKRAYQEDLRETYMAALDLC